ncbi:MAG TPA: DUF3147 family protein [Xanthomonadales bacterium]|nr:DUF3147 family protein [Xanthomonadales bacterium]
MGQYILKVAITALLVVVVSEVAKRSTLLGAVLAALPVTSLLAFVWLWRDTHDTARIASLSWSILWLVVPSLLLFALLPLLLRAGVGFWTALLAACATTSVAYAGTAWLLARYAGRG